MLLHVSMQVISTIDVRCDMTRMVYPASTVYPLGNMMLLMVVIVNCKGRDGREACSTGTRTPWPIQIAVKNLLQQKQNLDIWPS